MSSSSEVAIDSFLINLAGAIKSRGIETVNSMLTNMSYMDNHYLIDYAVKLISSEYKIDFFTYENIRKRGDYACARGLLVFVIKKHLNLSLQKIADEFPRETKRSSVKNTLINYESILTSPVISEKIKHNSIKEIVLQKIDECISDKRNSLSSNK